MRSHGLIIAPNIINNGSPSFSNILITALWHPFCFKAPEEALSWRVVPTVTFSAHTLRPALTTCHGFSKLLASVMGSLVRMKQHTTRLEPSVIRHLQRFSGQHAVRGV